MTADRIPLAASNAPLRIQDLRSAEDVYELGRRHRPVDGRIGLRSQAGVQLLKRAMWPQTPKKILLSYRRADTGPTAGRLADRLKRHFGDRNVFIDVDNIPFGTDFHAHIQKTIENCDFVLVIIGRDWVGRLGEQRRISDIEDHLRIEVETALKVGAVVIPVLVDRAPMPPAKDLPSSIEALAFLNAAPLDTGRDFNIHATRIAEAISSIPNHMPLNKNNNNIPKENQRICLFSAFLTAISVSLASILSYICMLIVIKYQDNCGYYGVICAAYSAFAWIISYLVLEIASGFVQQKIYRFNLNQSLLSIISGAITSVIFVFCIDYFFPNYIILSVNLRSIFTITIIKIVSSFAPITFDFAHKLLKSKLKSL